MAFCYNCGTKCGESDLFCNNCGTQLQEEQASGAVKLKHLEKSSVVKSGSNMLGGILMTNSFLLSRRLGCSQNEILSILGQYAEMLTGIGIDYSILDLANYKYRNPQTNPLQNQVSITSKVDWETHVQVLTDYYVFGYENSKPTLLFIVGGDDVIPMPTIDNYYYKQLVGSGGSFNDTDIATDFPYAYLSGRCHRNMISDGSIFGYDRYLCVGRLPFGNDATFDDFLSYFNRAISLYAQGGIDIDNTYAQVNPSWLEESVLTSVTLHSSKLLPPYSQHYNEGVCYKDLLLTPDVTLDNVDSVFNKYANMLFFNMHGSSNPMNPTFLGDVLNARDGEPGAVSGIAPYQVSTLERDNIIITEACYGAKFIGLNREYSMLLSSINSNTISYIGSSRIALSGYSKGYLRLSELLFRYIIDYLMCTKLPIGISLEFARREFCKAKEYPSPADLLTIAEFNLFGDPAMPIGCDRSPQARGASSAKAKDFEVSPLITAGAYQSYSAETKYNNNQSSILSMVRGAVDRSLSEIRDKINKHMYEQFNVEPRMLSLINEVKYNDQSKVLDFVYHTDDELSNLLIVEVDSKGEILNIITSK